VKLTANGHSYSTGPIESVQLVHYRNLTGDGAWVFNETADIILIARLDTLHFDSTEDGAFEYTITGELLQLCDLDDDRAKLSSERQDTYGPRRNRVKRAYMPSGLSFQNKVWARKCCQRCKSGDRADGHEL
jgi:hypothetical protein